jgi:tRNA-dihydrouridine synthase
MHKLQNYGAAAVMIGRGAKGRPWLFRDCLAAWEGRETTPVTVDERLVVAIRHARLLAEMAESKAPFMLRSVLMWYTKGLHGASEFRARICREENLETQIGLLIECVETHKLEETQCGIYAAPAQVAYCESYAHKHEPFYTCRLGPFSK